MDFWDLKHELDKGGFLLYYMFFGVTLSALAGIGFGIGYNYPNIFFYMHYAVKCIGEALFRLL